MTDSPRPPLNDMAADRRKFIANALQAAGGLALLSLPSFVTATALQKNSSPTVQQIIDIILKEGNLTPVSNTVDTIKAGSADQAVTSIVTTMFATIHVIEQAARLNANFIIAHEPTFYNHLDNPQWVTNNSIVQQKQALLEKHHITVWRFHDYCHALKPDAISYGVAKKAGWLTYFTSDEMMLTIPPVTLQQLIDHLKTTLGIAHVRVIGDLQQQCKRIALIPGASGGKDQVATVETEKPDVLIVGELAEWETAEYIRDQRLIGGKTCLIILGHGLSEEPGMEWVKDWLQPKLPGIAITHLPSGDPFTWL